jgi:hypothetical protein
MLQIIVSRGIAASNVYMLTAKSLLRWSTSILSGRILRRDLGKRLLGDRQLLKKPDWKLQRRRKLLR